MKQIFDETGVSFVQNYVLTLLAADLLLETQLLRADFSAWMHKTFDLHLNQQLQIQSMSGIFKAALADAIANCWEQGLTVSFTKETRAEDDTPDQKEIHVFGLDHNLSDSSQLFAHPLMIQILYKYAP
ncbi:hypothetical protein [Sphingobacterium kitahiroshimense]|uniref:Uncharacterized protein n=1 Tax=Sphingobacterium kitahiroshimense TaxID=470446 RepID=A0ABV0BWP7_9SPHI